ncbi:MAG: flagellar motor switch protein FliM [Burkholderiaceae bacterium]|jgi:flagellar motor switch protein FliM|nr:flagellar motor switch protein FliM [Burkholderiaceae bacterium]MEB2317830.1 flagellar motor switch protein FliM [Pseudomonadota bacterium]
MAEQFLSQDEVDALLVGVDGEQAPTAEPPATHGIVPYDLALQERIVRGRMPTLEIVNDRFARNLRVGLFNFMRRNPEIAVGPVKVQKYGDFLSGLVVPTNLNVMQIKPLRGSGLLVLEPQLVFAVIDTLFGGSGRLKTRIEGREFSATEQRIIDRVLEVICKDYRDAWSGVYPLELEYVRSEMQTQFANIATPSEIVITTSFALEIGDAGGSMHLCMPYATLEPIRETLYSAISADQSVINKRWISSLTQQLQRAEVELVADLGSATISFADILSLRAGDFVELDIDATVEARVNATPVFECRYGTSNDRYAIQIEKFLTDPAGLEGIKS